MVACSQMDSAVFLVSSLSLLLALTSSASADVCFWSGSCSNIWVGSCGLGRVKVDQSENCRGLCPPPRYPICHPFSTHILCCNEETPISSDECARCGNRVEVGNHWMCCSDGSEATVTNHELKTGFCRSGAQLSIQPKAREVFKWMFREWSECSASCGIGTKHRDIHCVGSLEFSPKQLYYVNHTKCDASKMPVKEESCRARSCSHGEQMRYSHDGQMRHAHDEQMHHRPHWRHRRGLPLFAKFCIFALTVTATTGLAFGGYVLYQRRKDSNANHGFVYVMLDNYS